MDVLLWHIWRTYHRGWHMKTCDNIFMNEEKRRGKRKEGGKKATNVGLLFKWWSSSFYYQSMTWQDSGSGRGTKCASDSNPGTLIPVIPINLPKLRSHLEVCVMKWYTKLHMCEYTHIPFSLEWHRHACLDFFPFGFTGCSLVLWLKYQQVRYNYVVKQSAMNTRFVAASLPLVILSG